MKTLNPTEHADLLLAMETNIEFDAELGCDCVDADQAAADFVLVNPSHNLADIWLFMEANMESLLDEIQAA